MTYWIDSAYNYNFYLFRDCFKLCKFLIFGLGIIKELKTRIFYFETINFLFIVSWNILKTHDEEFDPGSGWTLAAGLTHASRGVTEVACYLLTTGARVRNAYTIYLVQRDSLWKRRLTPHSIIEWHHLMIKTPVVQDEYAFY